jgi:hypothetical protein
VKPPFFRIFDTAESTKMNSPISPYHKPGFYAKSLARNQHRDIVGGRWDETGRAQMSLLLDHGLRPHHHLLDIGCGSLRLGSKAVPYLDVGHYWGTDLSAELMQRGYELELADPSRLPRSQLVMDADFTFTGVPDIITHALCFAVLTHLPEAYLYRCLSQVRASFPILEKLLFTLFLAPENTKSLRQPDGVVTHAARAPYHVTVETALMAAKDAGFVLEPQTTRLPRGQILFVASPVTSG